MKAGDPVRIRIPGRRRLLRGVVSGFAHPNVTVRIGLQRMTVPPEGCTVIRKRGERELVLARDCALRQQVRELIAARGNKRLARDHPMRALR